MNGAPAMAGERDNWIPPPDPAEAVELAPELRREVLALEARLDLASHYEVLGLPWGAGAPEASAAYHALAKRYHPDRHGGKRLGSYRARLERIMQRLAVAKDVLADDALRRDYEAKTAPPEEVARREARRIEDELRAEERRARLARTNPLAVRAAKVTALLRRGKELEAQGKHAQAANDFLTAVGLDPRHAEAQALATEARRRAAAERSRELYEEGLRNEAASRDEYALSRFAAAAELVPNDPRPALAASRAALRMGRAAEARAHASTAVRAGPRHAASFAALGAALAALGDKGEARKALARALELDPAEPEAKALVKQLRWSLFR